MATESTLPPANVKPVPTGSDAKMASPIPPAPEKDRYVNFASELLTLGSAAGPLFSSNIYRPRPVHYLRLTLISLGTASTVSVGDKNSQTAVLTAVWPAAGSQWTMSGPHNLRLDANQVWIKPSTGTTTTVLVEYLE